jgi:hypothetical protein
MGGSKRKKGMSLLVCMAVVIFALQVCGCSGVLVAAGVGAGVGAGTVAYIKGELKSQLDHSVTKTYHATLKGLAELKMAVVEKQNDVFAANVKTRLASGDDVYIKIKANTEKTCELSIRVGLLGDQAQSQKILDTIVKYL